jgi:hypothetical protein
MFQLYHTSSCLTKMHLAEWLINQRLGNPYFCMKNRMSLEKVCRCLRSMTVISEVCAVVEFSDELAVVVILVLHKQCCLSS